MTVASRALVAQRVNLTAQLASVTFEERGWTPSGASLGTASSAFGSVSCLTECATWGCKVEKEFSARSDASDDVEVSWVVGVKSEVRGVAGSRQACEVVDEVAFSK